MILPSLVESILFLVVHVTLIVMTGFVRNMNDIVMGTDGTDNQNPVGKYLGFVGISVVVFSDCGALHLTEPPARIAACAQGLPHHFRPRLGRAGYMFVNGFITIAVLALLALVSRNAFVFPSLGPTAHLLFFSPLAKTSSPRNTSFGHAVGLICGYAAFIVTGAGALPFGVHPGIFSPRILAAAPSLSATGAFMVLLDVSHPPAGATTLIVSPGIISNPRELIIIEVEDFRLVAQALVINRIAGLPYPIRNVASIKAVNEDSE